MRIPHPIVVDFESFAIEPRPDFPPVPVSVSIKEWKKKAHNFRWGHQTGNNCSWADAKRHLETAYKSSEGVLMHHAKFDLCVAERHFDLKPLPWDRVHDTMFGLFLDDPNQRELGLKPASKRILGWDPEERDAVGEWLVENQPVPGTKISSSSSGQAKAPYTKFLPFAPGKLVGTYADGDVTRTEALFERLYPTLVGREMSAAYNRERKLLMVLLDLEREGIPLDHERLGTDVLTYRTVLARVDEWLLKRLKAPELKLNNGEKVVEALVELGEVDPLLAPRTPTGRFSSNQEALQSIIKDRGLANLLVYRSKLKTCLNTFMENWLVTADRSGGRLYTDWKQTLGEQGGGTRTGRLSSSPNLQNIPTQLDPLFKQMVDKLKKELWKSLPDLPKDLQWLPPLPVVRSYVVPRTKGEVLIDRDFSQQEIRVLGHFEQGPLMRAYQQDPWVDMHDFAKEALRKQFNMVYERKPVKTVNLGIIYGEGVGLLAQNLGFTVAETAELKKAILSLYPGLKTLQRDMKMKAASNLPLITWGGRRCLCEPPMIFGERFKTFEYKMVNTLVQGSAADCTKEAIIRYHYDYRHSEDWLLINVHDQLLGSTPAKRKKDAMERLRKAMESVEFNVPMLSEGKWSDTNWASLQPYDKKGVLV